MGSLYLRESISAGSTDNPHASEAGIHIAEHDYWGRGLGTEALALWVDYLFQAWGLHRLGMTTWFGNPGMIRLAHRLGFVQEGCRRQGCKVNNRFYDIIALDILREEWESTLKRKWLRVLVTSRVFLLLDYGKSRVPTRR